MNELLVKTTNPRWLDQTVQQLGAVVCQNADGSYTPVYNDVYAVRMLNGNTGFLRFAITNQGYGEVVGEREIALA